MRNRKILITLLCAAFLTGCAAEQEAEKAPEQELEKYTNLSADAGFDTVYQQTEFGYDHDLMAEHYTKAVSMFSSFNDLFDIYNEYEGIGNLMTINANAGIAPVETDQRIIDMLKEAKMFYEISGGAFDITIGSLLHVWHEYRDRGIALNQQDTKAPIPSDEELKEAAEKCGWDKVVIDEENKTVFITEKGVSLDVGGIAKGYAAEAIGQFMETQDVVYATINAGRNIRTVHSKADGKPWSIGITDPSDGNSLYCAVEMDGSGSFVTSGDYERYYIGEDGGIYHHIIDPKTLKPADYYHSVSIITPDSGAADCLSTTLFTLSIEDGKKVLEAYEKETGNPVNAVWIMDPEKTQNEEGKLSGEYFCVYTDGIKDRITFVRN